MRFTRGSSKPRMRTADKVMALVAFLRGAAAFYEVVKDHKKKRRSK